MKEKSTLIYGCFLTIILLSFSMTTYSQIVVSGSVTSSKGETLPGVSVLVKGATAGTVSDRNGKYSINVPQPNSVLVFSFLGFNTQEVKVNGRSVINVVLLEDNKQLEQVVVTGYTTQKKVNVIGSVSTLNTTELTSKPVTQLSQAFQGKMPGVTVTQNFGLPGSDNGTIRIRGIGTLGNNNPLVLIDGVEGNLNDISPNDVESVSVLKDASASIYGSRAANGVILITTKRGRFGQAVKVSYQGIYGSQAPTGIPELVDGATYMVLRNEYQTNANLAPIYSEQQINEYKQKVGTGNFFNTDWYDVAMKKRANQNQHNLTIQGGSDKLASLVSLSYLKQDALVANAGLERYSIRMNTNFQPSKKIGFTLDGYLKREKNDRPNVPGAGSGNGITELFKMMADIPNIYPAIWPDGTYGEGWQGANPLAFIEKGGRSNQLSSTILLNLGAKYSPFSWLSLEASYAPKYLGGLGKTTTKLYPYRRLDGSTGNYPNSSNDLSNSESRTVENYYKGLIRFNKQFGKHSTSAFVATEFTDNHSDNFYASRKNFLLPNYEVLDAGSSNPEDRGNGGNATEWALRSYFGSLNYSYDNKYLLQADLRYDGSSRFAAANRWGWFPAVLAGWKIKEEKFLRDVNFISDLKLRGSWGKVGNQDIGNYPYLGTVSINAPYVFGNNIVSGAQQTVLNNPDVTWETTTTLNGAVDFGLLNNRLTGTLELYKRNTVDILYQRDIPAIIGLNASEQNIAEVQNIGWDIQLGWRDRIKDFRYDVDFVLSDVRNEVVNLNGKPIYGRNVTFEGEEYQAFYGYESLGIYRTADDLAKYPAKDATVKVGDLILKDQNGDGKITPQEDKKIIGSNIPRYTYGVTFDFGFKNFDLNVFLQGVGKKDLYYLDNSADYGGNYYTYQVGRFNPGDPSTYQTATYPRINGAGANFEDNSFYLYNAAYLRCKNVILGYSLPKSILSKVNIDRVRIFFSGTNLFTIDKLPIKTIDPEAPNSSGGPTYYPNSKVYSFGVDLQF